MINGMQNGSIIYDLAASQGGNAELTEVNKIIKIMVLKLWVKEIY